MLKTHLRSDRTMPAEVAVCIGQSPPSYEWKSFSSNIFKLASTNGSCRKNTSPRLIRQRSISSLKADILISKVSTVYF